MLVSASRRTDIPAFYSDWFFQRLREKYALVRHPMRPRLLYRIDLSPDVVDGIVFWTKNPLPMLDRLALLRDYAYYFQFTFTPYGEDAERGVPPKRGAVLPAFHRLSDLIGPERVIWRYDPIFLNEAYTVDRHAEAFDALAAELKGYTKKCVISFIDDYRHTAGRMKALKPAPLTEDSIAALARSLAKSAARYGLALETCAEGFELGQFGISHGSCVDAGLFERLSGYGLDIPRDRGQRSACRCAASIDLGAYGTCGHGCVYCYAGRGGEAARKSAARYDPLSPVLCGDVSESDVITVREVKSHRSGQLRIIE